MGGILVVGTAMIDVIAPLIEGFKPGANYIVEVGSCYGGGGANVAYYLAKLGDRVGLVSGLGTDPLGRAYEEYLRRLGVELYLARGSRTGILIGLTFNDGDRSFLADPGANNEINGELVNKAIAEFDPDVVVVHGYMLSTQHGRSTALRAAAAVSEYGFKLVFDPAYFNMNQEELKTALKILESTYAVTPNEAEAQTLASIKDPVIAASKLAREYSITVYLKRGSRGATLVSERGIIAHANPPTVKVVNSVGSGDTFTAVVAHGILRRQDPRVVLEQATHMASKTATCKCPQCDILNPVQPPYIRSIGNPE
ncbi:MAG: carbohydrate kinase family protein [Desulfurococcales archaeon]|nr:carbohydrate kinase family protein [Desulfurococcales archaeon]